MTEKTPSRGEPIDFLVAIDHPGVSRASCPECGRTMELSEARVVELGSRRGQEVYEVREIVCPDCGSVHKVDLYIDVESFGVRFHREDGE